MATWEPSAANLSAINAPRPLYIEKEWVSVSVQVSWVAYPADFMFSECMASVYNTDLEAPVISTFRPLRLYGMFVAFFSLSYVFEMD